MAVRTPHGKKTKEETQICCDCDDAKDAPVQAVEAEETVADTGVAANAPAREPLPPDVKRSLIAMAALAVFACLFSFIMSRANSPDKAVSTFLTSVAAQDVTSFSTVVIPDREDLALTEESMAAFLALYHDRTAVLEEFRETLNSDLALLKQGEPPLGNGTIRLVELDRVLHKAYRVELSGVDVLFSSDLDNTQVDVGGKTLLLETAGTEYTLPLLPGRYDIHAVHTNAALGQSVSASLTDCELTRDNCFQLLELEHSAVILGDIGWNVTSLTVNGVECGPVTFNDLGEFVIAPLPENVDIVVSYDINGVELRDSFTRSGSYYREYFYPSPAVAPETAQEMLDQVGIILQELVAAYRRGDPAALAAMPAYSESGVLQNYYQELAASLDANSRIRYVYHYSLREMEGDLTWTRDYSCDVLTFTTTIFLGLDYTYERYDNGELQTHLTDGAPSVYEKNSLLSVCVQRVDGNWVVSDLEQIYFSDRSSFYDPYTISLA